ncbi:MAG: ABC transporter ATP-binding protein [Phycisphaerae bacterium]
MLEVAGLTKVFPTTAGGEKIAVDQVSFCVPPGQTYGLLGPNGAGKTTTLRMLAGLISPSAGAARIDGHDTRLEREFAKRSLGYLTASTGLYQRLSPRETLLYFGRLHGLDDAVIARRIDTLLDWLDMRGFADLRCGGLSTGQKQRTNIARALIADPPVLVLDEPTLGLDVITNRLILEFIRAEAARGKTLVLSTHYLDEAETLCDRFGLIHEGRLLADGDLAALRVRAGQTRLSDIFLTLCGQTGPLLATAPEAPA